MCKMFRKRNLGDIFDKYKYYQNYIFFKLMRLYLWALPQNFCFDFIFYFLFFSCRNLDHLEKPLRLHLHKIKKKFRKNY